MIELDVPKGAKLAKGDDGNWYPADDISVWLIAKNGGRCEFMANFIVEDTLRIGGIANIRPPSGC